MRIEDLPRAIAEHPRFGPQVAEAVRLGRRLILNYHHHGDPTTWCVAVCVSGADSPLRIFGQEEVLEELAHIRGFGRDEAEGLDRCLDLGRALQEFHGLEELPELYLQGRPWPASNGGA